MRVSSDRRPEAALELTRLERAAGGVLVSLMLLTAFVPAAIMIYIYAACSGGACQL